MDSLKDEEPLKDYVDVKETITEFVDVGTKNDFGLVEIFNAERFLFIVY